MAATARENDETRAARLLMELIGGKKLAPADERWLRATNVGFGWTDRGGSWNIQQVRMVALLWLDGNQPAIVFCLEYLSCQLGESAPPAAEDDPLFFFEGTEQGSNTYSGWRWGFVLAVRLWALRNPRHPASAELLRLTARYSEVQTALLALGATPGPTRVGDILVPTNGAGEEARLRPVPIHTNSRGQLWWQGPSLPMSGNRSTPAHVGTDERMPMYGWFRGIDFPTYDHKRFGWPCRVLGLTLERTRGPETDFSAETPRARFHEVLAGIRLRTPHHFARWREEGVWANWIERMSNHNTTAILGHATYEHEQRAVYLNPWDGRRRKGLGEASCELAIGPRDDDPKSLVARSRFGTVSVELPARDPDSRVVLGPEGLQVLA